MERKKKEHDERSHLSYKALDVIVLFTMNIFEVDGNNKVCTSAVIFASKNYSRTKSFYLLNYHSLYEEHTYSLSSKLQLRRCCRRKQAHIRLWPNWRPGASRARWLEDGVQHGYGAFGGMDIKFCDPCGLNVSSPGTPGLTMFIPAQYCTGKSPPVDDEVDVVRLR